jgi:hypothetical protein
VICGIIAVPTGRQASDCKSYRSELSPTLRRIDAFLIRWARHKYKRLRARTKGAREWLARVIQDSPSLFAHWRFLYVNGRNRRLAKDFETTIASAKAWLYLASVQLLIRRLARG